MWPLCDFSFASALWLLGPLLLGLLTAWWMRSGRGERAVEGFADPGAAQIPAAQEPISPEPLVEAEPIAPQAFVAPAAPIAAVPIGAAVGLTSLGIAAAVGGPDDLLKIKGIGPKLNGVLNGLGVTTFAQIANWTADDVDKVDDHLGEFKNRIGQEEWIPQAKLLAAGNHAEWSRIYDSAKGMAGAAVAGVAAMTAIGIPAAIGDPDDLLQVKGIGPKLNDLLISLGVRRFDQIAAWSASDVVKVDAHLGAFKGRIDRDMWIEQGGLLARGEIAAFEAKFGKLDSENK